jgi:hypothetical protein
VLNRVTRYSLTTTLHWLNFSTQAFASSNNFIANKHFI